MTKQTLDTDLSPQDDHRHALAPGEHEAFFFAFTTDDGETFGTLRLILGRGTVMEAVALRHAGRLWAHQHAGPWSQAESVAGPRLALACEEPWRRWHLRFEHVVRAGEREQLLALDVGFEASTPPTRYRLGAYQQVAQDGRFSVALRLGDRAWEGTATGYRDHSWGRRQEGQSAAAWRVAVIPRRLYLMAGETASGPVRFGRILTPEGVARPVVAPRITATATGWRIEDPDAGLPPWEALRPVPPLTTYLSGPGQETIRDAPEPGDWGRDQFGPAIYRSVTGEQVVGFFEEGGAL